MDRDEYLRLHYLEPPCWPATLDSFGNRRLLIAAVRRVLPRLKGRVLDVGCGEMPYRTLICEYGDEVTSYTGLDLEGTAVGGVSPDLCWDGRTIPVADESFDTAFLTEVLEHCPEPGDVLSEVARSLVPGGAMFLTVPFIWPMHCVPHDEFRYTAFSLRRLLEKAGFVEIDIQATGGRNAVLSVMLGLWVRRKPPTSRVHLIEKWVLSRLLWPVIWFLLVTDKRPEELGESTLVVGFSVFARKSE